MALLLTVPVKADHKAGQVREFEFDISRQRVEMALNELAEHVGALLLFPYDLIQPVYSKPVKGRYTVKEALRLLLLDTELNGSLTEGGVITVSRAALIENQGKSTMNKNESASVKGRGFFGALLAAFSLGAVAQQVDDGGTGFNLEEVVVTGTRGKPRTVVASATPIDVINSNELLDRAGSMQLRDVLTQLIPSFQSSTVHSSSFNSVARPAGLRGMSGVHVLVLVNGKRRHNSSIIDFSSSSISVGGNPVDIDQIPVSSIKQIEVLRDGASAQYGTDAIAGVINIILKSEVDGGNVTVETGQRYGKDGSGHDGETTQLSFWHGFSVGNDGSLTVSGEIKDSDTTVRNSDSAGQLYFPLGDGSPDPREATADRRIFKGGLPAVKSYRLAQNLMLPINNDTSFYSDATYGEREADVGQAGRWPSGDQSVPEIYPDVFTPFYTMDETDFQVTAGVRTLLAQWDVDFSSTYGRNRVINGSKNSLNASLGLASPTTFDTFKSTADQWTNNVDFTRAFTLSGGTEVQMSFGGEFRSESYETKTLDEASYINGGYIYPSGPLAGRPARVGAQGALVVAPEDQADEERNVYAAYVDFAWDISPKFYVTTSGRFEDYDDSSGSVFSGKASARYEFADWVAIRGAISNGFRAPSLAQQGFAQSSTQFQSVGGTFIPIQAKTVKTGSTIAQALGADPLDPEESTNVSFGVTFTPENGLIVSVDAYRIQLDDRVTLTGLLSGSGINQILIDNGFLGDQRVRFFTNALDTRTQGVDVVGTYEFDTASAGIFKTSLGYNYNETEITSIKTPPSEMSGLGLVLLDRRTQGLFEEQPRSKLVLGLNWSLGRWGTNLTVTRYDDFTTLNNNPNLDEDFSAKWITDLAVSFEVNEQFSLTIGGNNIFDVYPDKRKESRTAKHGLTPYGPGPFGHYGGYYYGRLSYNF